MKVTEMPFALMICSPDNLLVSKIFQPPITILCNTAALRTFKAQNIPQPLGVGITAVRLNYELVTKSLKENEEVK